MAANGNSPPGSVRPRGIIIMSRVDSEKCYMITADTATRVGFKGFMWSIVFPQSKNAIGFRACPSSQGVA